MRQWLTNPIIAFLRPFPTVPILPHHGQFQMYSFSSINSDEIEWNLDDEEDFLGLSEKELEEISTTVSELMEEHDGFPEVTKGILEEPGLNSAQKTEALLAIGHGSMVSTKKVTELLRDRIAAVHEEGETSKGLNYTKSS